MEGVVDQITDLAENTHPAGGHNTVQQEVRVQVIEGAFVGCSPDGAALGVPGVPMEGAERAGAVEGHRGNGGAQHAPVCRRDHAWGG